MNLDPKKFQLVMAQKEMGVCELAEKANMSAASISKYARGLTKPSIKSLGKISKALNVDVEEIIQTEVKKE